MHKINCIIVDDEPVARDILETFVGKMSNLQLKKSCKNVMEAFEVINSEVVDLIFLDINMPEISGLTLAKSISKKTKIIFTTAYREYAIDGFDLQAVDYLLKPISFDRFLQAVQKYFEATVSLDKTTKETPLKEKKEFIFVRSDRKMIKIDFKEILYVESLSDYVKIHIKKQTIVTRETITNIESKLPSAGFLRVHRSYIIAVNAIESYTHEWIEIHKKAIPVSRSYKESVLQKLSGI